MSIWVVRNNLGARYFIAWWRRICATTYWRYRLISGLSWCNSYGKAFWLILNTFPLATNRGGNSAGAMMIFWPSHKISIVGEELPSSSNNACNRDEIFLLLRPEQGIQVPRPMKNADQLNAIGDDPIEDQIIPYRKTSQAGSQIVSGCAPSRVVCVPFQFRIDSPQQPVGGGGIVVGDVTPDIAVILSRQW